MIDRTIILSFVFVFFTGESHSKCMPTAIFIVRA
ncbi:unnamed protein product [Haemonchus placei]|uniref:Uncharacterized protein n=1 Tax=Haemonchus placei TaxID=6290 RepID=A0A0N4X4S0_HAEPC|nr:unnamed protein product [Haemonchus placei]